ncbi:hydrogenase accessory protein HypB [Candidatus Beckwithbacteria bacterium CG23_combo_of_CG06-09_8_20_14_all_34_8]|uniref:Hydrogenase accessory protein HypB n=1 Tax=Candidatus Beckwithbacteria bacterium CG23_combo_of_CG06-09_8_20_14_all_34_8 TaxID=1974497 RepID=A0A2H0B510_9BACT|nr:MAG: hydrogenase accessory protein HypB [Candidatus Beckwithbacteria bacterium CG23_combo_of_CG06-09_8_20_14_all_34_8]
MKTRILEIRKGILDDNDKLAHNLRQSFSKKGIFVVNVVSSPGSGKTELLTILSKKLVKKGWKVCVVVGDLATDNDAKRIQESGAQTYQINTNGNCHLDANMVKKSLRHIQYQDADILIIENVGNLVCPANYDLGENMRLVLMSTTEGEDKPSKYPTMFNSADICVLSKMDLAKATGFDEQLAIQNILNISPDIKIIKTSAKKDIGVDDLVNLFLSSKAVKD